MKEAQYAAAIHESKRVEAVASWVEKQANRTSHAKEITKEEVTLSTDLELAAKRLTDIRRQRIKKLFDEEHEQYRRELAAKGLAFDEM